MYLDIYTYIYIERERIIYTYICTCVYIYIHICMYVCMYICVRHSCTLHTEICNVPSYIVVSPLVLTQNELSVGENCLFRHAVLQAVAEVPGSCRGARHHPLSTRSIDEARELDISWEDNGNIIGNTLYAYMCIYIRICVEVSENEGTPQNIHHHRMFL